MLPGSADHWCRLARLVELRPFQKIVPARSKISHRRMLTDRKLGECGFDGCRPCGQLRKRLLCGYRLRGCRAGRFGSFALMRTHPHPVGPQVPTAPFIGTVDAVLPTGEDAFASTR